MRKAPENGDPDPGWATTAVRCFAGDGGAEIEVVGAPAQSSRLEALRRAGARVRMSGAPGRCCIVDEWVAMVRFTGPDSAIVVRDGAFVAERIDRFDDEFARGDEVAGLQVDR